MSKNVGEWVDEILLLGWELYEEIFSKKIKLTFLRFVSLSKILD
jgi:hypothetical protein